MKKTGVTWIEKAIIKEAIRCRMLELQRKNATNEEKFQQAILGGFLRKINDKNSLVEVYDGDVVEKKKKRNIKSWGKYMKEPVKCLYCGFVCKNEWGFLHHAGTMHSNIPKELRKSNFEKLSDANSNKDTTNGGIGSGELIINKNEYEN